MEPWLQWRLTPRILTCLVLKCMTLRNKNKPSPLTFNPYMVNSGGHITGPKSIVYINHCNI
ncbi:hypothetical protein DespoDRAFT_03501 [Desulfobacter postgatei 2ac9]|uniref:Uncharacterized protein n=1 Tax=Desulfobacter postgatei 2ac9 TaxID=879212 RepID=I5B6Z8_9BACT|nr:hypothetical protein DespoDRAFT_03501 [Desulfobacter postgatei 2ac9]